MLEFLIPIISFLGLPVGLFISHKAKEELEPGKIYFKALRIVVLLVLIITFIILSLKNPLALIISVVIGFLIALLFKKIYFYLGLALTVSFLLAKDFIVLISSLVFIYGLAYSTVIYKTYKKQLLPLSLLFFIPFILLFAKPFLVNYIEYYLGFLAGSLIFFITK
ncbi:MAG: hypothetical protein HYS32_03360 [Candidatus Woesearchaeota archaeon]|nr:MAG: hypothetical protein HYS32_03360 [Candidatus Woesearchaeota archaeon]